MIFELLFTILIIYIIFRMIFGDVIFYPCYRINDKHILLGTCHENPFESINKDILNEIESCEKIYVEYNTIEKISREEIEIVVENLWRPKRNKILAIMSKNNILKEKYFLLYYELKRYIPNLTYKDYYIYIDYVHVLNITDSVLSFLFYLKNKQIISLDKNEECEKISQMDKPSFPIYTIISVVFFYIISYIINILSISDNFVGNLLMFLILKQGETLKSILRNDNWIKQITPLPNEKILIAVGSVHIRDISEKLTKMNYKIEKFNYFKNKFEWLFGVFALM